MASPKLAYIILCHKDAEQVIRLIERLRDQDSFFVVHVDKRAPSAVVSRLVEYASQAPSPIYFAKRHRCYWGGFGIVRATIDCIKKAAQQAIPFDYVFLLSGQDYPIKSTTRIRAFLKENSGKEFIESFPLDKPNRWSHQGSRFDATSRIYYFTFFVRSRSFHLKKRRQFPLGLQPHGGSQWWCLSRDCITYLDKYIRGNPSLVRYFRFVFIPDESFFQSIIANSPFRDKIAGDNLHYIDWENPNPGAPRTLGMDDFDKISASGKMVGRKFDVSRSGHLLDRIDSELLHAHD